MNRYTKNKIAGRGRQGQMPRPDTFLFRQSFTLFLGNLKNNFAKVGTISCTGEREREKLERNVFIDKKSLQIRISLLLLLLLLLAGEIPLKKLYFLFCSIRASLFNRFSAVSQ
jgi:hypothetical protein